jgi:hypothetical protein
MLEQLLLFVLILFALLLRPLLPFLTDWLKRREHDMPSEGEPEASPVLRPERTVPRPLVARPPVVLRGGPRDRPVPTVGPPVVPRRRARSHLGSLQEVRRGIVLMTILGPCRALESPHPLQ